MNLYLIKPKDPGFGGYDTYDSAIVVAESEEQACLIHPCCGYKPEGLGADLADYEAWPAPVDIQAEYPGVYCATYTQEPHVILASYNAG